MRIKDNITMKLQELVNKLSNMLASGAGEAEVKIDDKDIESVAFAGKDGVTIVVIASSLAAEE